MKFLNLLKNKYFIVIVVLISWLLYFDKNDVFTQYELVQKCNKLTLEKEYYISEIENNKREINELENNYKSLETFAREKYLMKKDSEDVFVFTIKK
jgi:cell division protein FtsB